MQPAQLVFVPCLQIVDFQWNPHDPWTFMSVSDDVGAGLGGGTLQLWRVNDFLYRPEHEVLQELEEHRWEADQQQATSWRVVGGGNRRGAAGVEWMKCTLSLDAGLSRS